MELQSLATLPLTPSSAATAPLPPCPGAPRSEEELLSLLDLAREAKEEELQDLRKILEVKNSVIKDLSERLEESDACLSSLRQESAELRRALRSGGAAPALRALLQQASEGGARLRRCLAQEARLREEWAVAAQRVREDLRVHEADGCHAKIQHAEEEAVLHFQCLAAKTSAELAEAQLRAECTELRAKADEHFEMKEAQVHQLHSAKEEADRLRERLGCMARGRRTLRRRVEALCEGNGSPEEAEERCRRLCEEAAVAFNINAELEEQRSELLQSMEQLASEHQLLHENRELAERCAALELALQETTSQGKSSLQQRVVELEMQLAEFVLGAAAAPLPKEVQQELETLRQTCQELAVRAEEAATSTPQYALQRIEDLEAQLSRSVLHAGPEEEKLRNRCTQLEGELLTVQEDLGSSKRESRSAREEVGTLQQELQQAEGESKRLRDDVRAGEETAELREEELRSLRVEVRRLRKKLAES